MLHDNKIMLFFADEKLYSTLARTKACSKMEIKANCIERGVLNYWHLTSKSEAISPFKYI